MKKLFTLQKGRVLLLVLMLCLGFSKVLADEDGLLYQQYPITVEKAGLLNTTYKRSLTRKKSKTFPMKTRLCFALAQPANIGDMMGKTPMITKG